MRTNAQLLFHKLTAAAAQLRGIGRVHGRDLTTGACSLVVKQLADRVRNTIQRKDGGDPVGPEQPQASIVRRQGQVAVAEHEVERQVFQDDQPVAVDQPARELVPEVAPDVGDVLVQLGDQQTLAYTSSAALDRPCQAALSTPQLVQALAQPARVVDESAVRERQQAQQAHVTRSEEHTSELQS